MRKIPSQPEAKADETVETVTSKKSDEALDSEEKIGTTDTLSAQKDTSDDDSSSKYSYSQSNTVISVNAWQLETVNN